MNFGDKNDGTLSSFELVDAAPTNDEIEIELDAVNSRVEEIPSKQKEIPSSSHRFFTWVTRKKPPCLNRVIDLNDKEKNETRKYAGNKIKTNKYTIISFLPKNLFLQFHRVANIYFLVIAVLNWVPFLQVFQKEISMLPLVFVLTVTAVRDIYEDYQRYKQDRDTNNATCHVIDEINKDVISQALRVGDVIEIRNGEMIPADVLILTVGNTLGTAFIETSNLDGETNLKPRSSLFYDHEIPNKGDILQARGCFTCDPPNADMHHFKGQLEVLLSTIYNTHNSDYNSITTEKRTVSLKNMLYMGCTLKNTPWVYGLVVYAGKETKAMLNNSGPRYKRSKLEKEMNREVIILCFALLALCVMCSIGYGIWLNDINFEEAPFTGFQTGDPGLASSIVIGFFGFVILFQTMVPIALYITLELIKLGQVFFITLDPDLSEKKSSPRGKRGKMQCRALNINEDLGQIEYIFSDKTGTLTENVMTFQGCSVGGVIYCDNQLEDSTEKCNSSKIHDQRNQRASSADVSGHSGNCIPDLVEALQLKPSGIESELFTMFAICNTIIPRLDAAESRQCENTETKTKKKKKDKRKDKSQDPSTKSESTKASMGTSGLANSNVDTVQTKFNERFCTIDEIDKVDDKFDTANGQDSQEDQFSYGDISSIQTRQSNPMDTNSRTFMLQTAESTIAVTSLSSHLEENGNEEDAGNDEREDENKSKHDNDNILVYESESPDELALVEAAKKYGFTLTEKTVKKLKYVVDKEERVMGILRVIPFSSDRKRMSIIVQTEDGTIKLYTKGADDVILARLSENQECLKSKVSEDICYFSKKGLRTLCFGASVITKQTFDEWDSKYEIACNEENVEMMDLLENEIEVDLELIGASALEDKLQGGVPDAIKSLKDAEIRIWVLTGDKLETAVNIANSCSLFHNNSKQLVLTSTDTQEFEELLTSFEKQIQNDPDVAWDLVISGKSLTLAFQDSYQQRFVELACSCDVVLCVRTSPLQKSQVVKYVKKYKKIMALAIGDGANDVSMIQEAEIGVGISGNEGSQAVLASDFAISRFRFLVPLLLVHGHWSYNRLCTAVLYSFYKNSLIVWVSFYYQFYCGYSGGLILNDFFLLFYTLFFTSLPVIAFAIFDQNIQRSTLLKNPDLYYVGRLGKKYNWKWFLVYMLNSVYQSAAIFFIAFLIYGSYAGLEEIGFSILCLTVIVPNIEILLLCHSINWIMAFCVFISIFGFIALSSISNFIVGTLEGVPFHNVTTSVFWLYLLLGLWMCLFPRLIVLYFTRCLFPDKFGVLRIRDLKEEKEKKKSLS